MSPEQFSKTFVEQLQAALPDLHINVQGPMDLQVIDPASGRGGYVHLGNLYAEHTRRGRPMEQLLAPVVGTLAQLGQPSPGLDRQRIVPVIKDRAWLTELQRAGASSEDGAVPYVYDLFNRDLVIVYAEDSEGSIAYFPPHKFEASGILRGELRALAIANLERLLPPIDVEVGGGISRVIAGGHYEASVLLFDWLWSGGELRVEGDIVVAVPARDLLLFTGTAKRADIDKLRALAREWVGKATYPLTERLFVYRKGRFKRFD